MAPTRDSPPRPQPPAVPRWVGVVFPMVILAAIGFAVAHSVNRVFLPIAVTLAAALGIGLVAGFTVRWTLAQRGPFVRAIAALAALVVGLLVLGLVTRGSAGIGPFQLPPQEADWLGLIQLTLAAAAAWMALQAWQPRDLGERPVWQRPGAWGQALRERLAIRRGDAPGRGDAPEREDAPRREDAARRGAQRRASPVGESARPARAAVAEPPLAIEPSRNVRHRAEPANRADPIESLLDRFKSRLPRQGSLTSRWSLRRPSSNHRSKVRFSGKVEHRCPYCLDAVEPNDPRGVKVCSICHTHHHADCWAVTGMCQVPHHHPGNH